MTVTPARQSAYVHETNNVNKTNSLSQSSSSNLTQEVDKLERMQEKYQDIYTPIPETYSKADEDLQTQNIYEAYPNYISGQDFLKIVDKYYAQSGAEPMKLGTTPTQEQIQKQEEAFTKAYEEIGQTEKSFSQMQKDVQQIKQKYPINKWAKDGLDNAAEMSRFYNAGVYEGLESGLSVDDAKKSLSNIMFSYMGTSANKVMLRAMPNPKLGLEGSELFNEYVEYEKQPYNYNTDIDLREYGIKGAWSDNDVYKSDSAMIAELNKKISQFTFMLENPDLLQKAVDKMNTNDRPDVSTYQKIARRQELPEAQLALKIFENYKVYDSVNIKG